MKKICLLTCITVLSWIGWKLGERFGFMTAYWIGFIGSLISVLVGCRINRDYLP
jgi:putative Mn2+ efflux pump MntP